MEIEGVEFRCEGGQLWIGDVFSGYGHHQVLLTGDNDSPDSEHVQAFSRFKKDLDKNLLEVRNKVPFGFLYRPIRIAPNNENRIGVQFKNRITGNQVGMIFWD